MLRKICIFMISVELVWLFVPLRWSYFGNDYVVGVLGVGGVVPYFIDVYASLLFSFLYIISYVYIYKGLPSGRVILLSVVAFDFFLTPLYGVHVYSGVEFLVVKALFLGSAVVLVISYRASLERK